MALSYGRPVLVSDIPPFKEIITDEVNGFFFNSEDVKSLTTKLNKILRAKEKLFAIQDNGRVLVNDKYDVNIEFNESNAKFTFSNLSLICRLIDGKYPNYEAVIPKENPNILTIDRSLFLNSTKRVSIFSNKTTHQIRLKITGNELIISAEDLDYSNKAEERLNCNYNGDDIEIGFNSRFLTEMLSNLSSEEVKLELSLPNRAGILTPTKSDSDAEQVTMLVMPVMLNS